MDATDAKDAAEHAHDANNIKRRVLLARVVVRRRGGAGVWEAGRRTYKDLDDREDKQEWNNILSGKYKFNWERVSQVGADFISKVIL